MYTRSELAAMAHIARKRFVERCPHVYYLHNRGEWTRVWLMLADGRFDRVEAYPFVYARSANRAMYVAAAAAVDDAVKAIAERRA